MPTFLTFVEHLETLRLSADRLGRLAASVEEATAVPTCPGWDVRALVAHQAMVHRWATARVTGADPDTVPTQTEVSETVADLAAFYDDGVRALLAALEAAPDDLEVMTFLKDAPAPRHFWARRQAHETTIHMVDALAATLGRFPTTAEADIETDVAIDGIDELLRGFFTRGTSKLFDGDTYTVAVAPTDTDRRWTLRVDERLTVDPGDESVDGDATITGGAAAIYLALWNRGDEATVEGRPGLLERWRQTQRVRWS